MREVRVEIVVGERLIEHDLIAGVENFAQRPMCRLRQIELLFAHAAIVCRISNLEIEQIRIGPGDRAAGALCEVAFDVSIPGHDVLR